MKKILICAFLLVLGKLCAQKYDIQKVTVQDLEQQVHPKDPNAEAAVIYSIGNTRFIYTPENGFNLVTTVKKRIKIYKKEGYDWANKEISYYLGNNSSKEKVTFDDACTYNLVSGKIERTKLRSEGIFEMKESKYWSTKKIAMPNVKEGSIIDYEYTITSPYIFMFPEWQFQEAIPVDYSEFTTTIPEYFTYSHLQKGATILNVKNATSKNVVSYVERHEAEGIAVKASNEYHNFSFTENIATYSASHLKALKAERHMNSPKNYRCSLVHELMMTKYPNSGVKSYSTTWEDVGKTIHKWDSFGGELSKTGYFEDDISKLIAPLKSADEKAVAILAYVKANMKWNGHKDYTCDDGVRAAFKQKTGNAAEINLMLTAMLRYAGLNANPVLLSTRAHGISLFPATQSYDYVVSGLKMGDAVVLFDATEAYSAPNVLPMRDLNWIGLMIDKDGAVSQVPLTPTAVSNQNCTMLYKLASDGAIEGKFRRQLSENSALEFRSKHVGKNSEIYLEELENASDKIEISEYKRENESDWTKPFIESYAFRKSAGVEVIGDKMYLSPLVFLAPTENPFEMDEREFPVDFGYPSRTKALVMVELPPGYEVESLPTPVSFVTEGDFGNFKYSITNANGKLQLMMTSEISQAVVSADSYPVLKDFYQKMIDKQNEKIVLKRI